jgi:hypothetical protein
MTRLTLIALMTFVGTAGVLAEAAHDNPPTPPPTAQISLTQDEIQVMGAALANAGAACDQGVQVYCAIVPLRASVAAKLTTAGGQVGHQAKP